MFHHHSPRRFFSRVGGTNLHDRSAPTGTTWLSVCENIHALRNDKLNVHQDNFVVFLDKQQKHLSTKWVNMKPQVQLSKLYVSEWCERCTMHSGAPWSVVAAGTQAGIDATPAAARHNEAQETATGWSVRMAGACVLSGLVLLACLCSGRGSQEPEVVIVVMLYEQCYHPDINVTKLYELATVEARQINSSWVIQFLPEKGTHFFLSIFNCMCWPTVKFKPLQK